ncbi:ALI_collapsed_G0028990.mRNA.1.CDS.1 [Saccharomyces cerevisiae]|nr:ALI_collapsed_G0028990.mRNA.1.CDS.1 [Saccharomyces cerevisiae]
MSMLVTSTFFAATIYIIFRGTLLRGTGGGLTDSPGGRNLGSYIIVIGLFVQAPFFWVLHFHGDQIYDVYSKEMSLLLEGIQK